MIDLTIMREVATEAAKEVDTEEIEETEEASEVEIATSTLVMMLSILELERFPLLTKLSREIELLLINIGFV